MDYKIISFDLDGTLFGRDMEISRENSRALAELVSRGVTVIANTGRTYWELPESARNESAFRYYSYSNGAVLYDKKTDTVLRSACMPEIDRIQILLHPLIYMILEVHHKFLPTGDLHASCLSDVEDVFDII